jgi:hypothetical protein
VGALMMLTALAHIIDLCKNWNEPIVVDELQGCAVAQGESETMGFVGILFVILLLFYESGFDGHIRPDHGRMIWGEGARPGYGLYDRALGPLYLLGMWEALDKLSAKA